MINILKYKKQLENCKNMAEVKICDTRFPVYDPVEILDFDYVEDGAIVIEGE